MLCVVRGRGTRQGKTALRFVAPGLSCHRRPTFYVHEWYVWDGEVYDGVLGATRPSSEIETVACTNCGTEYEPSQFEEINFC
jgi:hypothetical protein